MNKPLLSGVCMLVLLISCSKKSEMNRELVGAVMRGESAKAGSLLSNGAEANAREETNPGRTALIIAASEDYPEIAALLVKHGADVNAKSGDGSSALMSASAEGNTGIVRLLLSKGADVNAADNSGQTSLIKASTDGQREVVELLIAARADINASDKTGATALIRAMINGHADIADILKAKGAKLTDRDMKKIEDAGRVDERDTEMQDTEQK